MKNIIAGFQVIKNPVLNKNVHSLTSAELLFSAVCFKAKYFKFQCLAHFTPQGTLICPSAHR